VVKRTKFEEHSGRQASWEKKKPSPREKKLLKNNLFQKLKGRLGNSPNGSKGKGGGPEQSPEKSLACEHERRVVAQN